MDTKPATRLVAAVLAVGLTGCVALPQTDYGYDTRCDTRSERKRLHVVNGFNDANVFYTLGGVVLLPVTGVVFGSYVALNNMYHAGEQRVMCGSAEPNEADTAMALVK